MLCFLICAIHTLKQRGQNAQIKTLSVGSVHSSQNSLSVSVIRMFCLVWICGESTEKRHADLFLSEFHKWALSVAYVAVKNGGKFEVVGGRVEDERGVMGPWQSGRLRVRNEANL